MNSNRISPKPPKKKETTKHDSITEKLHQNGFTSCFPWHPKPTFAAIHLYCVFSQTGEHWGGYRGGHTSGELKWKWVGDGGLIRDLQARGCWPGCSYLPAPDLGINFVLGGAGCYGRESLVHMAAWKEAHGGGHAEIRKSSQGEHGGQRDNFSTSTEDS